MVLTTLYGTDDASFTYVPGAPRLSDANPFRGPTTGGTTVELIGSGLSNTIDVRFGTTQASFQVVNDRQLTVVAPPGHGARRISATTRSGGVEQTTTDDIQYIYDGPPLAVTNIRPSVIRSSSPNGQGPMIVLVEGSGFTGASSVLLEDRPGGVSLRLTGADVEVFNDSLIIVRNVDLGSYHRSGFYDLTVGVGGSATTPDSTSTVTPVSRIQYILEAPTITSLSPNHGSVFGGDLVTIDGTSLGAATQVTFDGRSIPFTQVSRSRIQFEVPARTTDGATVVDVRVTTPGGTTALTSSARYTYDSLGG